ncbi:hypothetical protein R3I94_009045 [Phoxinus phoxinus]
MGKNKDLSDFEKGQIVMARRLGTSITETAKLVDCSRSAVVKIYQQWSEEGQTTNRRQGVGRPRLIDARGQLRLTHLVRDNRKNTVAQVTQTYNDGNVKNVSQYTVHRTLLRMGLRRSIRCASTSQPTALEGCGGPTGDSCSEDVETQRTQMACDVMEHPEVNNERNN